MRNESNQVIGRISGDSERKLEIRKSSSEYFC